ncbi:hypothetical protein TIFTF001_016727 [Ficus carica]|uniref:FAR1 domain-containing protein n=1 Tax=Ficus carica TaxID=3494 RepID=A0AA88AK15_FICCA|nr:hypothetical protein TIFTF001_016727 [Ficus carica]
MVVCRENESCRFKTTHTLTAALNITSPPHLLTQSDIEGKELDTPDNWRDFYYTYSKWTGFSVRMEDVQKDSKGKICQRLYVCYREG